MEFRNLFNVNNNDKRVCADTSPHATHHSRRADIYAPHLMPRLLSEDVGVPELRIAHAMAATRMKRDRQA